MSMIDHPTRRAPEMEKYVEISKQNNVYLTVENQSFLITPHGCDDLEMAEWMRDMLCIALANLVRAEKQKE